MRLKRSLKALSNLKEIIMKVDSQILLSNSKTSPNHNSKSKDFSLDKMSEDELKQVLELEQSFCKDFDESNADLKTQYDKCILRHQKVNQKINLEKDRIWSAISTPKECKLRRLKSVIPKKKAIERRLTTGKVSFNMTRNKTFKY